MNRRDSLLHEMQITQWVLRKPQVLKGDGQISLSADVKLVVICDEDHQQSQLFQDVLRCLQLDEKSYHWSSVEQSSRLIFSHLPFAWLISDTSQAVVSAEKYAKLWQTENWQFQQQSQQKRQLWQQIPDFYHHFQLEVQ